jgi:hypothetical protein
MSAPKRLSLSPLTRTFQITPSSSHPPLPSIAAPQTRSNTYRLLHPQYIPNSIPTMPKRTFACVNIPDAAPQKYSLEVDLNRYQMAWYPGIRPQKEWAERTEPQKQRRRNNSWVPTRKRGVVGIREQSARRGLLHPLPIRVRAQKSDEEPPPPTIPMALLCLPNPSAEHTAWKRATRDAIIPLQFDATELMTNTGALKRSWTQGVDPNSC